MIPVISMHSREHSASMERAHEACEKLMIVRESLERSNVELQDALARSDKIFKKINNSKVNKTVDIIINFVKFIFSLFLALYVYCRDILTFKKVEESCTTIVDPDLFQEKIKGT